MTKPFQLEGDRAPITSSAAPIATNAAPSPVLPLIKNAAAATRKNPPESIRAVFGFIPQRLLPVARVRVGFTRPTVIATMTLESWL